MFSIFSRLPSFFSPSKASKGRLKRQRRRLFVEGLEDRRVLSTVTVGTLADEFDTDFSPTDLSLREAIAITNAARGHDTIRFADHVRGNIAMMSLSMHIDDDLTIEGPGAGALTIDGNIMQVFLVQSATTNPTVEMRGLTITNADAAHSAVYTYENLVLREMVFQNCRDQISLWIVAALQVEQFDDHKPSVVIENSLFAQNRSEYGAITQTAGTLRIANSTFSGNEGQRGAALDIEGGTAVVVSSTISGNRMGFTMSAGAVRVDPAASLTLHNTIVAGNGSVVPPTPHDIRGTLHSASSHNLIGDSVTSGGLTHGVNGNIVGNAGAGTIDIHAVLETTLRDNGGPTLTHAVVANSPALDAGSNSRAVDHNGVPLASDQRGAPWRRILAASDAGKAIVDIGAFEWQSNSILVDSLDDVVDGDLKPGGVTLREAIEFANAFPGRNVIHFAPELANQTIVLQGSHLVITDELRIEGPGTEGRITIDGGLKSRIFDVQSSTTEIPSVELRRLNLTRGQPGPEEHGGGIQSTGSLLLDGVYLDSNRANDGGGIHLFGSNGPVSLTVLNSTFSGNQAFNHGGAILVDGNIASTYVGNSTISGNVANEGGGGLCIASGPATIVNSTIVNNSVWEGSPFGNPPPGTGGGLWIVTPESVVLNNTIVVGNHRRDASRTSDQVSGPVTGHFNLIADPATAGGLANGASGNIVGLSGQVIELATVVDPVLRDNGGGTPTHALTAGSLARESGSNVRALGPDNLPLATDQRGLTRLQDADGDDVARADIGAVEIAPPTTTFGGLAILYNEGDGPLTLAPVVEVADLDSTGFDGGSLSVALSTAYSDDRLQIRHIGTGAGEIGVDGSNVSYGGTIIGTFAGGAGSTSLLISFNANGTVAAAQALLRAITFHVEGFGAIAGHRPVTARFSDGDGGISRPYAATISVTAINNPTELVVPSLPFNYFDGSGQVVLAGGARVTDADSPNFDGGHLIVRAAAPSGSNRLSIKGGVFGVNNEGFVFLVGNSVEVGRMTSDGVGVNDLRIALNDFATPARVQTLVRNVTFGTVDATTFEPRVIDFLVYDGDGGVSNLVSLTVNVMDPDPVITLPATKIDYINGGESVLVAAGALVTDPNSLNFDGGQLLVRVTPGHPHNRLFTGGVAVGVVNQQIVVGGVAIGTLASDGLGLSNFLVNLNAAATPGRVQTLLRALRFQATERLTATELGVTFRLLDGDGGISDVQSVTLNVVNIDPVIHFPTPVIGYMNGRKAILIAGNAVVSDPNSLHFDGGELRVRAAVTHASNQLQLGGTLSVVDGEIVTGDVVIGTLVSDGLNGADFAIRLNAEATIARVQDLVRAITFRTAGASPTGPRAVTFSLLDGAGGVSNLAQVSVNVRNGIPVLTLPTAEVKYVNHGTFVPVAADAAVFDPDSANFEGGQLLVRMSALHPSNQLALIGNWFGVNSNKEIFLLNGGLVIGTLESDGLGNNDLLVRFTANATPARVQALIRTIKFRTSGPSPLGIREVNFTLLDGDGGVSAVKGVKVNVVSIDPVITLPTPALVYTNGSKAILIASDATVSDPDSTNFDGGQLQVRAAALHASNRLALGGAFGVNSNKEVFLLNSTIVIGTLESDVSGAGDLVVRFNANATLARVQALIRTIRFRTEGVSPTGPRQINFSLLDGDGGASNLASVTVNVNTAV